MRKNKRNKVVVAQRRRVGKGWAGEETLVQQWSINRGAWNF